MSELEAPAFGLHAGDPAPYRKHKRPLRGIGMAVRAMWPIAPNVIWALDFQFDQTSAGRIVKLLNVIDQLQP